MKRKDGTPNEWKIGFADSVEPDRRQKKLGVDNRKSYQIKESWQVKYRRRAEKVVHVRTLQTFDSTRNSTELEGVKKEGQNGFTEISRLSELELLRHGSTWISAAMKSLEADRCILSF